MRVLPPPAANIEEAPRTLHRLAQPLSRKEPLEFKVRISSASCRFSGAGDRDRTGDIQLGKLTFCH